MAEISRTLMQEITQATLPALVKLRLTKHERIPLPNCSETDDSQRPPVFKLYNQCLSDNKVEIM